MSGNGYYSEDVLKQMGFSSLGKNVKISEKASLYGISRISIGSNVRIDDYVTISAGVGGVEIGSHVHIGVYSSLIGAGKITLEDFVGVSGRVSIYSSSDDYTGMAMSNPTVPEELTKVTSLPVLIKKHSILGAGCVVLPKVIVGEGVSVGALSLVNKSLDDWYIYSGNPIQKFIRKARKPLELEKKLIL
ncbi:TPA: acyltransferase [Vibrio cholerae]|nr:acyltransferase [Vibrio cholerae]